MKKIKIEMGRQLYRIGFGILFMAMLPMLSLAKDSPESEQHFTKEFEVDDKTLLELGGYDHPVTIEHWNENKIFIDVRVVARGEKDQVEEFMNAIEMVMEKKGNTVSVKTNLNISCLISVVGKKKIKVNGEGWIKLEDYYIDVHIKMPNINPVDADLSYCDLDIQGKVLGDFKLKNYEAKTKLGDLLGDVELELTYGEIEVGNIPNPKRIKLYEMDFVGGDMGACSFVSRYSKIHCKKLGALSIESYEDKIYFEDAESLKGTFSYSIIEGESVDVFEVKLYECKVIVTNMESMNLDSKYSNFDMKYCKAITLVESYENKFDIGELLVLSGPSSKYDVFNISILSGAWFLDAYETKIDIAELSPEVTSFILKGKYNNADLIINSQLHFDLEMDLTYPNIDYPKDEFGSSVTTEGDKLKAFLKSKHANPNDVKFSFEGYELNLDISVK